MSARYAVADWTLAGTIASLTVGQKASMIFGSVAVPLIFYGKGLDLKDFWPFALVTAPIWIKWAWAPVIDRTGLLGLPGRKGWLIATTTVGAFLFLPLIWLDPGPRTVAPTIAILLVQSFVMATQDVTLDGYTVDQVDPHTQGLGAVSAQVGENSAYLVGLGLYVWIHASFGWSVTVLAAAATLLLFSVPGALRRERLAVTAAQGPARLRDALGALFRRSETPIVLIAVFVGGLAPKFVWTVLGPLLVERGLTMVAAGAVLGAASCAANIAGSLITLVLIHRFGMIGAIRAAQVCAVAAATLYFALLATDTISMMRAITIAFATEMLLSPAAALLFAVRLDWCSPDQPSTEFAFQSSVYNLGKAVAAAAAGGLAVGVGWPGFFLINALLLVVYVAALLVARTRTERIA